MPVTKISFVLVVTALSYLKSCPCTTILYYSKSCQGITLTKSSKKYGTGCLFLVVPLNFPSTKILYNLLASFNVIRLPCSCLRLLCVALCCIWLHLVALGCTWLHLVHLLLVELGCTIPWDPKWSIGIHWDTLGSIGFH